MSAELAVALPAVLLVLAACLGGLRLGAEQVRLADAAGIAARSIARRDAPSTTASLTRFLGSSVAGVARADGIVCATVASQTPLLGTVVPVRLTARSCALEDPLR